MNMMFNPSIFALVLSAVNAASARSRSGGGEGDKVVAAEDSFYGRENEAFEKTTAQRRAEKIFPLNNNANKDSRPIIGSGGVNPDVGILLQGERLRRLQSGAHSCDINHRRILQSTNNTTTTDTIADDVDYAVCGTMCKPAVCDCIYNIWCDCGVECASEIDAVCNGVTDANGTEWTIQGCITDYPQYPGYQEYFINVFCPFAKCIVDGGTFGSCWCQGYKTHCEKFGDERIYVDYQSFCDADACCETQVDEAGRKSCFEFMGTETTSPSTSTVIPPPTPISTGDSSGGSPDASQETPSSAAGRLMSLDSVGATSSIAIASAVVWSILN